jgi:uncharacterized protein (UPF0254 family)
MSKRRLYLYVTQHRQNLVVLISTQFAHCNNVSIGVSSLSTLHTSEPDSHNGATYKTQTENHKRVPVVMHRSLRYILKNENYF